MVRHGPPATRHPFCFSSSISFGDGLIYPHNSGLHLDAEGYVNYLADHNSAYASQKKYEKPSHFPSPSALGCILEIGETWTDLRRWVRLKRDLPVDEENPTSWVIPIGAIGLLLVIAGVVGEGVFEALVSNADTALRLHDSQILRQTQMDAASANDRATAAENHAAEVEESIAPRRLTKGRAAVAKQLTRFAGQPVAAISNPFDVEASVLAADIIATLHLAGWQTDLPHMTVGGTASSIEKAPFTPRIGILVSSGEESASKSAAKAVVRVLSSEGFDCRIPKKSVVGFGPNERMVIVDVEARPEGPQGEAKLRADAKKLSTARR